MSQKSVVHGRYARWCPVLFKVDVCTRPLTLTTATITVQGIGPMTAWVPRYVMDDDYVFPVFEDECSGCHHDTHIGTCFCGCFDDREPKHKTTEIGTLAPYFRKRYAGKCPHIFMNGQGYCMKHRCVARRRWIREYKASFRIPLLLTELRRNAHVLDAIEGIQFNKED
jgi:hypothetical protein